MVVNRLFRTSGSKFLVAFSFSFILLFIQAQSSFADATKGKELFQTNCASCHNIFKDMTGPALMNVESKVPSKDWIYNWVHNPPGILASGDKYAQSLYAQFKPTVMTAFPQLSKADIDDILDYVKAESAKGPGGGQPAAGTQGAQGAQSSGGNNSLLFGILSLVLAIVAVILMQINSNLHKLTNEKEGEANPEPVPFYRNKKTVSIIAILLFVLAGYFLVDAATTVGYDQNYQPQQPIFYSHKVHAGINQINCLYCHAGAEKSRYAMIPSVNICMNCHKTIDSYTHGPQLFTTEGKQVDGTAEIQKLYEHAGWDPQKRAYTKPGKPIEWIKIHNLPDYVYFNHSQHVKVGKVQCQTCHGPIQDMNEVYQYASLGMGWCINCHRTTKVQFTENKYYDVFSKFQDELKNHQIDSVTVEMQGGTECQKCHY